MLAKPATNEARPRFEYYPLDSPKLHTVEIDRFPFVIGRTATASFQINSTSVSREHAEIDRTPTGFCLRDLGSTNGTTLNGTAVREVPLTDGDTVAIADIELTFVCTSMGRLQRTLTKPLPGKKPLGVVPGTTPELASARTLNEALLLQAIPLDWSYLLSPAVIDPMLSIVRVMSPLNEEMSQADAKTPTRSASRLEVLAWRLALERHLEQSRSSGRLLGVVHRETLDHRLPNALADIEGGLVAGGDLGIYVSWEWATASPDTLRVMARLKQEGRLIVYADFSGGGDCIASMESATPDYIVLSKQVTQGVSEQTRRLQRLGIVQSTCHARGIELALPRDIAPADRQACERLGIGLAQCDYAAATDQPLVGALA